MPKPVPWPIESQRHLTSELKSELLKIRSIRFPLPRLPRILAALIIAVALILAVILALRVSEISRKSPDAEWRFVFASPITHSERVPE